MNAHQHFVTVAEFRADPERALRLAEDSPLAVIGDDGKVIMTISSPRIGPIYNGFKAPFEDDL